MSLLLSCCSEEDFSSLEILISLEELLLEIGREEKHDENELYKLLIQRMPIDSDGELVFPLDEIAVMH